MTRWMMLALGALTLTTIAACSDDDGEDTNSAAAGGDAGGSDAGGSDAGGSDAGGSDAGTGERTLSLTLSGLEPLGSAAVYEGWLIVDGAPQTTGRFNIEEGTESYEFTVPGAQADAASMFVLSIEPAENDDPAPADAKVLAGPLDAGSASLSVAAMPALGTDFGSAAGQFILETPTTTDAEDYKLGIWWLDPNGGSPTASLTLPELPAGWTYEGWVVGDAGPISTGTFDAPDMADSDGAGSTAGSEMAPPFPGQDFITDTKDLTGMTAVISVEPVPDDSPAPFAIKPLVGEIMDSGAGTLQSMNNMTSALPSGSVTIE